MITAPPRVDLPGLGISLTPMTVGETVRWATEAKGKALLLNHNLHSAYLFQKEEMFRALYAKAQRTVIDGAPILVLARRKHSNLGPAFRIGSTDWLAQLSDAHAPGRLLVYGATERSNQAAVARLQSQLQPLGWFVDGLNGFVPHERTLDWLRASRPTLVIVGLGMPRQEQFLLEAWNELPDAVYATVGGAIDYIAGEVSLAPRWVGNIGFEWLWRLAHDPRRLASRYLVEPVQLVWSLITRERARSEEVRGKRT